MQEKNNFPCKEMLSALKNANSILLCTHISPDGDAIGSTLAMGFALEAMGKQVDCNFTVNPGIKEIVETDMLEEDPRDVDVSCMHFGSFEIKTLLLYF